MQTENGECRMSTSQQKVDLVDLEKIGLDLTARIRIAEESGDKVLIDQLILLKLQNNKAEANHVIISNNSGQIITA